MDGAEVVGPCKATLSCLLNIMACRKPVQLHGLRTIVDGDLTTTHLFARIIKSSAEGICIAS